MGHHVGLTVLRETPGGGHELELEFLSARLGIKAGDDTILVISQNKKNAHRISLRIKGMTQ